MPGNGRGLENMSANEIDLRAVVYREGDVWIAHCLELDIAAEGKTSLEARRDLGDLCALQIRVATEDGDLSRVFRAAPPELWHVYFRATKKQTLKNLVKPITRFDARELVLV
jgi:hypothetical protein